MLSKKEMTGVFFIGALGYMLLELLWRGRTHWSMGIAGGICFVLLHEFNLRTKIKNRIVKCLCGGMIITLIEFAFGCVVNLWMRMNVWNYERLALNFLGQTCLLYSALWSLLCIPIYFLSTKIHEKKIFVRFFRKSG